MYVGWKLNGLVMMFVFGICLLTALGSNFASAQVTTAPAQTATAPSDTGQGLTARYYGSLEIKGKPIKTWIHSPSFKLTPNDKGQFLFFMTIRFTGSIQAPKTGDYVFRVEADNGGRLVLDGNLLTDSWTLKEKNTLDSKPVHLEAGRSYDILMDFLQNLGEASLCLKWRLPGEKDFVPVPVEYLSPTAAEVPLAVNRIRFYPAKGRAADLVGGKFSGSVSAPTADVVTLAKIDKAPPEDQWSELEIKNDQVYRYVKYDGPKGSFGAVADIAFYHDKTKLEGQGFGTTGSRNDAGNTFEKALDGDPATFFEGMEKDSSYAGIDLGEKVVAPAPTFDPPPGNFPPKEFFVTLRSPSKDSFIIYTLDGSTPQIDNGALYTSPLPMSKTTALQARAFHASLADSVVAIGPYNVTSAPMTKGLRTFHTGNSLNAALVFLVPIAQSAGFDHFKTSVGAAGAPTDWLYLNQQKQWEAIVQKDSPIDVVITQPFAGHGRSIANETEFTGKFYEAFRAKNPEARLMVYMQWPTINRSESWSQGFLPLGNKQADQPDNKKLEKEDQWEPFDLEKGEEIKVWGDIPGQAKWNRCRVVYRPAKDWDEAMQAHRRYFEILRHQLAAKYPQKPVYIIPVGLVLLKIKEQMAAGKFPGFTKDDDFFNVFFSDNIHQSKRGEYVTALTQFVCLYGVNPVGKVTSAGSELTQEQAAFVQQLVWDTVTSYPWSGVKAKP